MEKYIYGRHRMHGRRNLWLGSVVVIFFHKNPTLVPQVCTNGMQL